MAFDHKSFGTKIGMGAEDLAALDALFTKYPTAGASIETELTAQVDARLTPLQKELADKQKDLDAQFETLAAIRSGDTDAVAAAEKRIEVLSGQHATLVERVKRVARDAGLNPDDVLKDLEVAAKVETKVETPGIDAKKVSEAINMGALNVFEQSALLEDLRAEHASLFPGKPFYGMELIQTLKDTVKRTGNTNLGLRDVFEQKYNVTARREEIRETDVQKRIKEAEDKARTEERDKMALRGTQSEVSTFVGSPLLETLRPKDQQPQTVRGVPVAVSAAMADFSKRRLERKAS